MEWQISITEEFESWFLSLSEPEQIDVRASVELLKLLGPDLKRPYADSVKGTKRLKNLKELRIQHRGKPYRVFFAFGSDRRAILLCGGRKDGRRAKQFYSIMISRAEKEFFRHV